MTDARISTKGVSSCDYLAAEFEPTDRVAILLRNRERREIVQRIATADRVAEPSFQHWLEFKNHQAGFDVYVGMNPLNPNARTRTKEDILAIRHLYVDLDHEGPKTLNEIRLSDMVPKPNYILTTSPEKFQVVWRVADIAQDHAESLLRAMARTFRGDPAATDSARVLRLPGFLNQKYDEKFLVTAERLSDRVYGIHHFKLRIEHGDSLYQPTQRPQEKTRNGQPSQSEHDWAYAKSALAKGANPEEVIRNIAVSRSKDKHDPDYYARHTVEKAQAELKTERSGIYRGTGSQIGAGNTAPEK
jgi:hypothetical protein